MAYRLGILSTHPIQYYSPLYRELARRPEIDLTVYYAHQSTAKDQADAGFGVQFEWDVPLLDGYASVFLQNRSKAPSLSTFAGCDTPEIYSIIRDSRFDGFLVHGWYNRSYWQAIRACWRTGTPVMVRGDSTLLAWRQNHFRRAVKWFTHRALIPRFDAYLVVGQRAREYYLAYGADPARMEFSPHFVDNGFFASRASRLDRNALRAAWGIQPSATVFLFAGKFMPRKRPLDFIEAINIAARGATAIEGLMVGDGEMRNAVEKAVRQKSMPVHFTGFLNQSRIPDAYSAADVLVLPSAIGETWGLVVNEAMACGLPAVVSDRVGCAADLVLDNVTGFTYPAGNIDQLAARMLELSKQPELRSRLACKAQEKVQSYSCQNAADGICRALSRIGRRELV